MSAAILFLALTVSAKAAPVEAPATCTYTATVWNAKLRRTTRTLSVSKPRSKLTPKELGPSGCTPCREDQREIELSNGLRFLACAKIAEPVKAALDGALADGALIETVVGYRAQYSKGELDSKGERTELSNHAFGAAFDVNEGHNGLYDRCEHWGPRCRLIKAGRWDPPHPLALTREHPIALRMKAAGLSWGGEIAGRQKDFMHFSPTGY